jgi:hypothetical protein
VSLCVFRAPLHTAPADREAQIQIAAVHVRPDGPPSGLPTIRSELGIHSARWSAHPLEHHSRYLVLTASRRRPLRHSVVNSAGVGKETMGRLVDLIEFSGNSHRLLVRAPPKISQCFPNPAAPLIRQSSPPLPWLRNEDDTRTGWRWNAKLLPHRGCRVCTAATQPIAITAVFFHAGNTRGSRRAACGVRGPDGRSGCGLDSHRAPLTPLWEVSSSFHGAWAGWWGIFCISRKLEALHHLLFPPSCLSMVSRGPGSVELMVLF